MIHDVVLNLLHQVAAHGMETGMMVSVDTSHIDRRYRAENTA
jgi:hypothetical protein